jgi:hypothetical protein
MRLISLLLLPFACIAGTWTDLGSGTLFSRTCIANAGSCTGTGGCTSGNYAFNSNCSNKLDAWNGGDVFNNGTMFFTGSSGGHDDYLGNEVVVANLTAKTIANVYTPSCFNFGSGSTPCASYVQPSAVSPSFDTLPDGSPQSHHTYGGVVCVDRHSTCYQFSGAPFPGIISRYMWEWPYTGSSASSWTQTTQFSTTANSPNTISCADNPTTDLLYCAIGSTGAQYMYAYNYATHAWTFPSGSGGFSAVAPFAATAIVDNKLQRMIFVGNRQDPATTSGGIGWIDLTGSDGWTYHDVTSIARATCGGLMLGEYPGLAYDPNDGMYVGKTQAGSTVYIINPQTWTCTTDNPPGAPANASNSHGLFGRWRYSAALNGFVTLNEWNQDTFVYHRDYGLGHSTAVCIDRDGDGYGVGQIAQASTSSDLVIAPAGPTPNPPVSPTMIGTPGSTTWYYFLSACYLVAATGPSGTPPPGALGVKAGCSPFSAASTPVTNANATLSATNYVQMTWPDTAPLNYIFVKSHTSTPPALGTGSIAGSINCTGGTCTLQDQNSGTFPTPSISAGMSNNVTSSAHPFTNADFGTTITVTAGAGFQVASDYTIQSVNSGVATLQGLSDNPPHNIGLSGATGGTWRKDGCLGPDADDLDASVQTESQAVTKWGSLQAFLWHQGYSPNNYWYLDPVHGSDANACHDTNASSALSTPCATWAHIQGAGFTAGDMVLMRGATYTERVSGSIGSGTSGAPIILKAFPGEEPIFTQGGGMGMVDQSWFIVDGLTLIADTAAGSALNGGTDDYQTVSLYHDNIFRHMRVTNWSDGFYMFNGMVNLTIEDSMAHDEHGTTGHGFYIGSREIPDQNINFWRNISYNNDYTGMQHNGRGSNIRIQWNLIHSNLAQGISFENGFNHSTVSNNIAFNNHNADIVWAVYDYNGQAVCPTSPVTPTGVCDCTNPNSAYCGNDENYNVIENNSFYQTGVDRDGVYAPAGAVNYGIQDASFPKDLGHNTYRNNIFYGAPGIFTTGPDDFPPFEFNDQTASWLNTTTFDHNIFKSLNATDTLVLGWGQCQYFPGSCSQGWFGRTCSQTAALGAIFPNGTSTDCQNINPQYTAASPSYSSTPASFNFTPAVGSPAIGAGTGVGAPPTDVWGAVRPSPPSIGAVELVTGGAPAGAPAVSSLSCSPTFLGANGTANCTVVLSQAALTGGATVILSSTAGITTPGFVVVPAGSSAANFAATTGAILSYGPVVVTATLNASSQSAPLKLFSCDLNGDGVVNNLDVQIAVNQALGISACSTSDLQNTGQCNVVDVQRVIDASLGGVCRIGP